MGEETTSKQPFFKHGRHFHIPKSCFVLFALPKHEWKKLDEWFKRGHHVETSLGSDGEVLLLNETKLEKWRQRKKREGDEA